MKALRLFPALVLLTFGQVVAATAQNALPGDEEVSFKEAVGLFVAACIRQGPSFSSSEAEFRRAGLTVSTVTGGLAHTSKGLTGRFGGFAAPDGNLVQYCELSAAVPGSRSQLRQSFIAAIQAVDHMAVKRDAETLTAVNQDILSIYKIESSLASGRATFSIMASYLN